MRTDAFAAALTAVALLAACSKPEPAAGAPSPDAATVDSASMDSMAVDSTSRTTMPDTWPGLHRARDDPTARTVCGHHEQQLTPAHVDKHPGER